MAKARSAKKSKGKARAAVKSRGTARASVKAPKKGAARKAKKVSFIPQGMHSVMVSLCVNNTAKALEFYKSAFGATVRNVMPGPGGKGVMHAEFKVGGTTIMIGDEFPGFPSKSPEALGAPTSTLYCYVPNCDKAYERAVNAGAQALNPLVTMFWGDRMGNVKDPFGHIWTLATHVEDVSAAQLRKRHEAFVADMAKMGGM